MESAAEVGQSETKTPGKLEQQQHPRGLMFVST